jgi:hypothetical protein
MKNNLCKLVIKENIGVVTELTEKGKKLFEENENDMINFIDYEIMKLAKTIDK